MCVLLPSLWGSNGDVDSRVDVKKSKPGKHQVNTRCQVPLSDDASVEAARLSVSGRKSFLCTQIQIKEDRQNERKPERKRQQSDHVSRLWGRY